MKAPGSRLAQGWTKLGAFLDRGVTYLPIYLMGRWRELIQKYWYTPLSTTMETGIFLASLDLDKPSLSQVAQAVARHDHPQAETELVNHFKTRQEPRFHFAPQDKERIGALIPDHARSSTIRQAEAVCQNIFTFRGVTVHFEDKIAWEYCPQSNTDWTWDMNRHGYFIALGRAYWYTGDESFARRFGDLLADWIAHNPVGLQAANWQSVFEVAYRINAWIWAYYHFRNAPSFDPARQIDFLKGLLAHACFLDANIEHHVPNNHLLLEAKALALVGLLFPEFKEASKWQSKGLKILFAQVERQASRDGVFKERAILYHNIVTGELLELVALLRLNGRPVPATVLDRLSAMIDFQCHINKPDQTIPLFGDSALTDTYVRFSPVPAGGYLFDRPEWQAVAGQPDEATAWLLGAHQTGKMASPHPGTVEPESKLFAQGGYAVMRAGLGAEALYLAFDCGPFGYRLAPGHGHADALSFELYAHGHSLLVDPGVYSYHLGTQWRNYFRGTSAHNTAVVDEAEQSVLLDDWRVRRPARVTLHRWIAGPDFDLVDASHDGYRRRQAAVTHRRQIFFARPEYWVVIDTFTGKGEHCFDLYFHLSPQVRPLLDSTTGTLHTTNSSMTGLAIVPLARPGTEAQIVQGQTAPIQGWVSFYSGEKQEAPVLHYRYTGSAPVQFCTLLYPTLAGQRLPLALSSLAVAANDGRSSDDATLTGLKIQIGPRTDYLVLDRHDGRALKLFAGHEKDGHVIYIRDHRPIGPLAAAASHPAAAGNGSAALQHGAATVQHGPAAVQHHPAAVQHHPAAVQYGPAAVQHGSAAVQHSPAAMQD